MNDGPIRGQAEAGLAAVARRFREGEADGEELTRAFAGSIVLSVVAHDGSGFLAFGEEGSGYVPMYSSTESLTAMEGPCEWFAGRGSDLARLVPEGYGVVLDPGSDSEVILASWAIGRREMPSESGNGEHRP